MSVSTPEPLAVIIVDDDSQRRINKTDIAAAPAGAVAASRMVLGGGDVCEICGWSFVETTGTVIAEVRLWDGNAISTEVIVAITLAAGQSTRDFIMPHGIRCSTGRVFLQVVSGSVEGTVYWR